MSKIHANEQNNEHDQRAFTYLVGIGVTHSIAPAMHNHISKLLEYCWHFEARECPTVQHAMELFRLPSFAGGVVTMPYKTTIMPLLDGLDEYASKIGACNNVYRARDGSLRGTNTEWRGVSGCLKEASNKGAGKPALIIGAGGASRAAVYALYDQLGCSPTYVVNRDHEEFVALSKDTQGYGGQLEVVHLQTVSQVEGIKMPYYIVGTVPDFEPQSSTELEAREILKTVLSTAADKGVLLDMCFKPRRTRHLKLAEQYGWQTVEGIDIIGHQIQEQYRLWCGEERSKRIDEQGAWAVLRKAAEESSAINF